MKSFSEYIFHCIAYLVDSEYRENSRIQKVLRKQKKTVENRLTPTVEKVQDIMYLQQFGSE